MEEPSAKELINLATLLVCVWQFAGAMGGMLPHASVTGTLCKLLPVECCPRSEGCYLPLG